MTANHKLIQENLEGLRNAAYAVSALATVLTEIGIARVSEDCPDWCNNGIEGGLQAALSEVGYCIQKRVDNLDFQVEVLANENRKLRDLQVAEQRAA